jgi:hypothetical protein
MTTTEVTHQILEGEQVRRFNATQAFSAPGVTDWIRAFEQIAVQITGGATSVTAQVERSTEDPAATVNPAPAGDPITGNPATGIKPVAYAEPGAAWWRVNLSAVSGGTANVSLAGKGW